LKTILFITGTRPEIIKMAPVYLKLTEQKPCINLLWCHTGQHGKVAREMFAQFDIKPDVILDRPPGEGLSDLLGGLVQSIDNILDWRQPHLVLVHGDTSSTLAAALAAFYRRIPIAHVEAGLRSGDLENPYPEESNRRIVGMLASRHYAPTPRAAANLLREGACRHTITITGNTVVDAQKLIARQMALCDQRRNKVLVTMHRRENWPKIQLLCEVIRGLAYEYPALEFVLPVHPNPAVSSVVLDTLADIPNVVLSRPLGYLELQRCLSQAVLAITDSGGIQEEAPGFNVPCVVLRQTTERPEAIESGQAVLAGTDASVIEEQVRYWLAQPLRSMENPFGDGQAATRIWEDIKTFLALVEPQQEHPKEAANA